MPETMEPPTRHPVKLVIVTGSGRSGTSTVAGTLKRLGLHVPQPENPADAKNPRGYYEPAWVTRFDKRLLAQVGVHNNDARPEAADLTAALARDTALRHELREWLAGQLQATQLVVKDPHILWLSQLWVDAARTLGVTPSFVTMLRHPAEVVGSRDRAYLSKRPADFRRLRETANVAGWVNIMLTNERVTRPYARSFVRYTDLIADWRRTMQAVASQLDLDLNADLSSPDPHDVDEFIDTDLRRSRVTWDDIDVPDGLREIAEAAWDALGVLVDKPHDPQVVATLEELRAAYDRAHDHAVAFANYRLEAQLATQRAELEANHRAELAAQRRRLRRGLDQQVPAPAWTRSASAAKAIGRRVLPRRVRAALRQRLTNRAAPTGPRSGSRP